MEVKSKTSLVCAMVPYKACVALHQSARDSAVDWMTCDNGLNNKIFLKISTVEFSEDKEEFKKL